MRSKAIKIVDFKYYDGCENDKERNEAVSNEDIKAGGDHTYHDDLEYVEGCKVPHFKVKYKEKKSDTATGNSTWNSAKWTDKIAPTESDKVCVSGKNYTIEIK